MYYPGDAPAAQPPLQYAPRTHAHPAYPHAHPPYPPPPYTPTPTHAPHVAGRMPCPPPYGAPFAVQPHQPTEKYGFSAQSGEAAAYATRMEPPPLHQQQDLVCTCHPVAAPSPVVADDDGLMTLRCSCPPEHHPSPGSGESQRPADPAAGDARRRSTSRGSNFSEDSLTGDVASPAPALSEPHRQDQGHMPSSQATAQSQPQPQPPVQPQCASQQLQTAVVMRNGGGGAGARSPQKRRSLTQEYLAAQAEANSRRNSQLLQLDAEAAGQGPSQALAPLVVSDVQSNAVSAPVEHVGNGETVRNVNNGVHPPNANANTNVTGANASGDSAHGPRKALLISEEVVEFRPVGDGAATVVDVSSTRIDGAGDAPVVNAESAPGECETRTQALVPAEISVTDDGDKRISPTNLEHGEDRLSQSYSRPDHEEPESLHSEPEPRYPSPSVEHSFGPDIRRKSLVNDDKESNQDIRRLSQVYNEPMVSLMPETRILSQPVADDTATRRLSQPTLGEDPSARRYSQSYDDRVARNSQVYDDWPPCEPQRLSQAYTEHAAVGSPHHAHTGRRAVPEQKPVSQMYDDRSATAYPRRLSQPHVDYDAGPFAQAYDGYEPQLHSYDARMPQPHGYSPHPATHAYDARMPQPLNYEAHHRPQSYDGYDARRIPQPYDDRPATADHRRYSQSYDDRPATADPRQSSQVYESRPAAADSRRYSQPHSYDDRPASSEARRLSHQAYDDRPATSESRRASQVYDDYDSRRSSQLHDDRATESTRRLSQSYDDRPASAEARRVSQSDTESRRLSQVYDDRPATAESRRLSQAYEERPASAEMRRLSEQYDDRPARPVSRSYSHSYLQSGGAETADGTGSEHGKPACQKYDERPCTAAADSVPAAVAVKPWWEKKPDRRTPAKNAKPKNKDSPSRRSSVDRTWRGAAPASGSPDPAGAGDAEESPVAFTVDLGPAAAAGGAGRRLHVKDSISRWAPKYRRSLSSAHKDEETRSDSGELAALGTSVPRPRSLLNRRKPGQGYHSEGYFSSDQDADNKERRVPRGGVERPPSGARSPSPRRMGGGGGGGGISGVSGSRLSAARRATVTRATGAGLKKSATLGTMPSQGAPPAQRQRQPAPAPARQSPADTEEPADDVSEAGTYTIENEPDDNRAQQQAYDDDDTGERRRHSAGDSSSHEASPDRDADTPAKPSAYGTGSNWIEQWAAEVTKHNQHNLKCSAQHSPSGSTDKPPAGSCSPWSRHTISPDGGGGANRPRRKLPTPPAARHSPSASGDRERAGALATSLETESYLRTTEDVVSALQARLDASTATGDDSDSVSSDSSDRPPPARDPPTSRPPLAKPAGVDFKFNRALSLRRARLGLDDGPPAAAGAPPSAKTRGAGAPSPARASASPAGAASSGRKLSDSEASASGKKATNFARTDGGRFSLRMANGTPKAAPSRGSAGGGKKPPGRSGPGGSGGARTSAAAAAQATRDQEMANWKRRKNYDPLKAAREARRTKLEQTGVGGSQSDSACGTVTPLRSASFHGTDGLGASLLHRRRHGLQSEDEALRAATSGGPAATVGGALRHAPAAAAAAAGTDDSDPSEVFHDDVAAAGAASTRKVSLDASSRRASPLYRGQASSSLRNKVKLEALDNLVISTIHTLSSKIRGDSESLVSKLKCQFDEEDVRHTLLDDVMTTLTTDTPSASKASSRDLAGILKNLRKVEQAVQVLEQVLCDDEEDVSEGEELATHGGKFGDGFY